MKRIIFLLTLLAAWSCSFYTTNETRSLNGVTSCNSDASGGEAGAFAGEAGQAGAIGTAGMPDAGSMDAGMPPPVFHPPDTVLGGQSNAVGSVAWLMPPGWVADPHVLFFGPAGGIATTGPIGQITFGPYNVSRGAHGIELTLGNALAAAAGGADIHLGKTAVGGTACTNWIHTGTYWPLLRDTIIATHATSSATHGVLFWLQGENESALVNTYPTVVHYKDCLHTLAADVRGAWGIPVRIYPFRININIPLSTWPSRDLIRKAQDDFAAEDGDAEVIDEDDIVPECGIHYCNNQTNVMGTRAAAREIANFTF